MKTRWKLTCLRCGEVGYGLVPMQEHLMEEHGLTPADLQGAQKTPDEAGSCTYEWQRPGDEQPYLIAVQVQCAEDVETPPELVNLPYGVAADVHRKYGLDVSPWPQDFTKRDYHIAAMLLMLEAERDAALEQLRIEVAAHFDVAVFDEGERERLRQAAVCEEVTTRSREILADRVENRRQASPDAVADLGDAMTLTEPVAAEVVLEKMRVQLGDDDERGELIEDRASTATLLGDDAVERREQPVE